MKNLFYILTILAFGFTQAQPQKVNYQAVALTAGGQTVKNQAIKLRLSILDSSATGTVLYTETHQPTTDGAGQFSVFLGGGTATLGTFSTISWSNGKDKFLKAEADLTGGTNYVLMGTSQIVSVPYALATGSLMEGATITGANGSQYTLTVGANGPTWQQSSGPGGVNMNYPCPGIPTVAYGGQTYNTVQIGTQCWFKENLNVGTMVQGANDQTNNGVLEKYCYNNDTANCSIYGGLYQWAEAVQYQNGASNTTSPNPAFSGNVRGICPTGWHVPADGEWIILENYLGGSSIAGGVLKSTSTLWNSPNTGATNISGFSALPGGSRNIWGTFVLIGNDPNFWSSFEYSSNNAFNRRLYSNYSNIDRNYNLKNDGYATRCLKD
jgi:uncharacterized protein (TIGR02145 family)